MKLMLSLIGLMLMGAVCGNACTVYRLSDNGAPMGPVGILPGGCYRKLPRFPDPAEMKAHAKEGLMTWLQRQDADVLDSAGKFLGSLPGQVGRYHWFRQSRTLAGETALTASDIQMSLVTFEMNLSSARKSLELRRSMTRTVCKVSSANCAAINKELETAESDFAAQEKGVVIQKAHLKILELSLLEADGATVSLNGSIVVSLKKDVDWTTRGDDDAVLQIDLE
jgi:hypothetical protein